MEVMGFTPPLSQGVADLIVSIQRDEFAIDITYDDQPDLQDISAFYQNGTGNFWVALDGANVVGTIALKDIGNDQAALRKMFVAPTHRGPDKGVAQELLNTLLGHARMVGLKTIYLGTTAKFLAAHRFYEKTVLLWSMPVHCPKRFHAWPWTRDFTVSRYNQSYFIAIHAPFVVLLCLKQAELWR